MKANKRYIRALARQCEEHLANLPIVRAMKDHQAAVARALSWHQQSEPKVTQLKERNLQDYAHGFERMFGTQPPQGATPAVTDRIHVLQRVAAVTIGLTGIVMGASQIYNTSDLNEQAAAMLSLGLVLVVALMLYTSGRVFAAAHLPEPRYVLARLERWQMKVGVGLIIALGVFLTGFATEAAGVWIILLKVVFAIVVTLAASLSGLLLATADLRHWNGEFVQVHYLLVRLEERMALLRRLCAPTEPDGRADKSEIPTSPAEKDSRAVDGADHNRQNGGSAPCTERNRPLDGVPGFVGAISIACVASIAVVPAQVPAAASPQRNEGAFYIDESGSPRTGVMKRRTDQTFEALPTLADQGIDRWQIYRFYEDVFEADPVFTLDLPAFGVPECPPLEHSEAATWLKHLQQREKERWEKTCNAKKLLARQDVDRVRAENIRNAKAALVDEKLKPTGQCTGLIELFLRVAVHTPPRLRMVVVLSDGREFCDLDRRVPLPAPPDHVDVFLIVVPAQGSTLSDSEQFQDRQRYWARTAPWLRVVPGNSLVSSLVSAKDRTPGSGLTGKGQ